MSIYKEEIKRLSESCTSLNETIMPPCPACGKDKFTLTRIREGILYNCYRASCSLNGGFIPDRANLLPEKPKPRKLRPYTGEINPLTGEDIVYFIKRFGFQPVYGDIHYNQYDEYVFPVKNLLGRVRGYVVRQPIWKAEGRQPECHRKGRDRPKARLWMHADEPAQSFYFPDKNNIPNMLVVVEDQVSALKLYHMGYNSCALLGTDINDDKVREWSKVRTDRIVICLDQDATAKSFAAVKKYANGLDSALQSCILWDRDIKDLEPEEIRELL